MSQSYENWECVISINGSTDSTSEICSSINDSRFKIITSDFPNKSLALNRAIISSKGEWISILDADDLWREDKLESQVERIKMSDIDICGTQMIYIDSKGQQFQEAPTLPIRHEDCVAQLNNQRNPIANSSVVYRKSIHDRVGYYDPEKFVEDYDLWMRAKRANFVFANLDSKLLFHRVHESSHFNSSNRQALSKLLVDETDSFYLKSSL
jgi:glycosyltransferase involved in cell wall biosynthesis